ncbi:HAD family phosphatase [Roseibium denhamense]|uniref:2-haloacid dehalogenase n=1 Tax=Roseibium denhamense TaxID=76305 RepID=A0ABY1P027_9HYPH|nr:HAD family phosphatase [Roseibium denhamense]MTI05093.1 HAD family phosphatase [Roseibium denhamense]SMP22892.1 2-haloacid dehalogenase [Roseibium denhamense]
MSKPITAVIFDIGNVLIEWNPEYLYRRLIPDPAERHHFLTEICSMDWNIQQDLGRSWEDAVSQLSAQYPDKSDLIRAYSEGWHDMVPGEVPGTLQLLQDLKKGGMPLYAITNFSSEKFTEAQERFPFLKTSFLDIVVSAEEQLIKPDPAIYRICLQRNALDPENCLFIDDSLANVEAARALGIAAHHFKGAQGLEKDLKSLGLLTV